MRELDPKWQPRPSVYSADVEGVIARNTFVAEEARARVNEVQRQRADFPGEPVLDKSNMQDKLQKFALNAEHLDNDGRAVWFKKALGFDQSNWKDLADQIYFDEKSAEPRERLPQGQTYRQTIPIRGANGRTVGTTFGFIKDRNGVVRLTTIYPGRK